MSDINPPSVRRWGQATRGGRQLSWRWPCLCMALVLVCLGHPHRVKAQASMTHRSSIPRSMQRARRAATEIVRGRVVARETRVVDLGRRLMTIVKVAPSKRYGVSQDSGSVDGEGRLSPLDLVLPGGRTETLIQRVGGVIAPEIGETVLLFMSPYPGPTRQESAAPDAIRPRYQSSRLGEGVWVLDRGRWHCRLDSIRSDEARSRSRSAARDDRLQGEGAKEVREEEVAAWLGAATHPVGAAKRTTLSEPGP